MRIMGGPLGYKASLILNAVGNINISNGYPWLRPGTGLKITAGGSVNVIAETITWNCGLDPQCATWNSVHSSVVINANGPITFTARYSIDSHVDPGPPIDITCFGPGPNNIQNLTGGIVSGC
jgi:hypothetical protein